MKWAALAGAFLLTIITCSNINYPQPQLAGAGFIAGCLYLCFTWMHIEESRPNPK